MDLTLLVTLIGTILTAIGTVITLVNSARVRKSKNEIINNVRRINLIEVTEQLKRVQEEIRKILTSNSTTMRGKNIDEPISRIQSYMDISLNTIDPECKDNDLREKIRDTQNKLNSYTKNQNKELLSEMQNIGQDIISIAKGRSIKI